MRKPSPIPELSKTPQANQMAEDKFNASSSVLSALANRNRPKVGGYKYSVKTASYTSSIALTKRWKAIQQVQN